MEIIGRQVRFPPENVITYFQDFHYHRKLPSTVVFTITDWQPIQGRVRLAAPGYGAKPYGNGKISLSVCKDLRYAFP